MYRSRVQSPHRSVARERGPAYGVGGPTPAEVVAALQAGASALAMLDTDTCSDDELAAVILAAEETQRRLAAHEGRALVAFDDRQAYQADACVNTTTWLRHKTTMGYTAAKRRVKRAALLERMAHLRQAYEDGLVATEQVDVVATRAIPSRVAAIAEHDETLAVLATNSEPRDVAIAVQRIIDEVDRDGSDEQKPCDNEDLRGLELRAGFAGLGDLRGATTPVLTELLRRVRTLFDEPDGADTPAEKRRTPAQRYHDALVAALCTALDNHPGSTFGGVRAHIFAFADLFTLLGDDELATIQPRLLESGVIDPEIARHLVATTSPTLRMILGMGPWLPVTVSRTKRLLPDWLLGASYLMHQHCIGPGCTVRKTESDHTVAWEDGGETSLFNTGRPCAAHHDLKHRDGWTITFNPRTGVVTWTNKDGTKVIDVPPPDL